MSHVLIVQSRFYPDISDELVRGAATEIEAAMATSDMVEVPGAFEIPAAIRFAMESEKYDGFIALGCVIRGETTHYDYVCAESARALMELSVSRHAAIGYGILTVNTVEQAWTRADVAQGNKGAAAARACLTMIGLKQLFGVKL